MVAALEKNGCPALCGTLGTRLGKPDISDKALGIALEKDTKNVAKEIDDAARAKVGHDADNLVLSHHYH